MPENRVLDILILVAFSLLGAWVAWQGWQYGVMQTPGVVGPGTVPFFGGMGMAIIATACAIYRTLHYFQNGVESQSASGGAQSARFLLARKGSIVFAALALAVVATPYIGFVFSFSAMVFGLLHLLERRRLVESVATALISGGVIHLTFVEFLHVPLP